MYDVVIVGARCAGAPLAMLLAGAGHRVLVVDRATFPSDTMSTHFIQAPGIARLANWGLLDDVLATGCPLVHKANFTVDGNHSELEIPLVPSFPGLAAPRRYILDKILVDAAVGAGAEFEQVMVDSLLVEGDRVGGVKGHTSDGPFEATARFVIGADGRNSVVAQETGSPFANGSPRVSAGYYSYFHDVDCDAVETYFEAGLFAVVIPTNDELVCIAVEWPREEFPLIKRDPEGNFMTALDQLGTLGDRVRAGHRVERFVGGADLPNYLRRLHGPGWALVGDAGYHKDPAPADGISDAFRGADFLAEALNEVLSGNSDEQSALDGYEQRHNEYAVPLLDAAVRVARFDYAPQQRMDAFFEIRINNHVEVEEMANAPSS